MTLPRIHGTISKGLFGPGLSADEFEADLITGQVDLEGDVTPAAGATPSSGTIPLLWNHNSASVVGVARYTRVGNKLQVKCTLIPAGTTPEGDLARVCAKGDWGVGLSAGFQPSESTPIKGTRGRTYNKYRLLEASLTAVPCDPAARITARAHDAERAERKRRAAELARESRMELAKHYATPPLSQSPPLTRAEKLAKVAAVKARGEQPARRGPLSARERIAEDAAAHASQVNRHLRDAHPSREERRLLAGIAARQSRPLGFA